MWQTKLFIFFVLCSHQKRVFTISHTQNVCELLPSFIIIVSLYWHLMVEKSWHVDSNNKLMVSKSQKACLRYVCVTCFMGMESRGKTLWECFRRITIMMACYLSWHLSCNVEQFAWEIFFCILTQRWLSKLLHFAAYCHSNIHRFRNVRFGFGCDENQTNIDSLYFNRILD